jgi:hypothetical protein
MNIPEHSEKPSRTKKANRFDVNNVICCYTRGSSYTFGTSPLMSRKDKIIVMNGLIKSTHMRVSLLNYCMRLINMPID